MGHEDREERIRERAYAIWEREGHPQGRAVQHWEQASREIEAQSAEPAAEPVQDGGTAAQTNAPNIAQRAAERASGKAKPQSTLRNTVAAGD